MRPRSILVTILIVVAIIVGVVWLDNNAKGATLPRTTPACGVLAKAPVIRHVVVVMEENHSYSSTAGSMPYLDSVAKGCGLATNYHSTTHNSLPNYLAMTAGIPLAQLQPFTGDCTPSSCTTSARSIFAQTVAKSYEETMPSNCDWSGSGIYVPKHNPQVYFTSGNASCGTRDVPFGPLTKWSNLTWDFRGEASAPSFAFVTPNLCNDGHDCGLSTSDAWLRTVLPLIEATPVYQTGDTAIFVVWDEGEPASAGENCAANPGDQSCHVELVVIAPSVKPGTKIATSLNHYSVLRAAEQLLGLPYLGQAASAPSLVTGFNL